jgi:Raf kinase inhibitor-like YbhB/YbcL family protein
MQITVTNNVFEDGGMIPAKYTADGQDISPPLTLTKVPEGVKSIALIADDPDAPGKTWVHWVMWNIPPEETSLEEGVPADKELPNGARQGKTDFGTIGYGGPAPPSGVHRYFFKVYALDTMLDLSAGATKLELERAMEGHILSRRELMGRYTREK